MAGMSRLKMIGIGAGVLAVTLVALTIIPSYISWPFNTELTSEETIIGDTTTATDGSVQLNEKPVSKSCAGEKYYTMQPGKTLTIKTKEGCKVIWQRTAGPIMQLKINNGRWVDWDFAKTYGTNNTGIEQVVFGFKDGTPETTQVTVKITYEPI
jgi:hypothetical protein